MLLWVEQEFGETLDGMWWVFGEEKIESRGYRFQELLNFVWKGIGRGVLLVGRLG
jgi:hypothetical protein